MVGSLERRKHEEKEREFLGGTVIEGGSRQSYVHVHRNLCEELRQPPVEPLSPKDSTPK